MNYLRNRFFIQGMLSVLLLFNGFHASAADKWEVLTSPVSPAPAVVEFFSFYCPACYAFSQTIAVDRAIRQALPEGNKMVKYHASALGPLGHDLTRTWALAMTMKMTDKIESAFFNAIMVEKTLSGPDDIRRIFIAATGITAEEYDKWYNSEPVTEMVLLQERLFNEYGVRGTPSVYIRGKYHINNMAFSVSPVEQFRASYVSTVRHLLNPDASQ